MNKQIINVLQKPLRILLTVSTLCIFALTSLLAFAQDDDNAESVESVFVVWKDGSFVRSVLDKNVDYSKYTKVMYFPLKYDQLEVVTGNDARLGRNWEGFVDEDMPTIAEKFDKAVASKYKKGKYLELTKEGGSDVIVIAVNLLKLTPRTYRDSSLDTVGEENFETVGFLDYQITLLDSEKGVVVGFIEDQIQVSLRRKARNVRGNHVRAWTRTFEYIVEHLRDDIKDLAENGTVKD